MRHVAILALALIACSAFAKVPDCAGPDRWPAMMVKNQLMRSDIAQDEITKTTVTRISSQKIKFGLYSQVHLVQFDKKNGNSVFVITVSDASHAECSGGHFEMYPVSQEVTLQAAARSASAKSSSKQSVSNCSGPLSPSTARRWLTDAGVVKAGEFDLTKAILTPVNSQRIGKNLVRQVNLVTLAKKSDEAVRVLTVDDVSNRECHVGKVDLYVLS